MPRKKSVAVRLLSRPLVSGWAEKLSSKANLPDGAGVGTAVTDGVLLALIGLAATALAAPATLVVGTGPDVGCRAVSFELPLPTITPAATTASSTTSTHGT